MSSQDPSYQVPESRRPPVFQAILEEQQPELLEEIETARAALQRANSIGSVDQFSDPVGFRIVVFRREGNEREPLSMVVGADVDDLRGPRLEDGPVFDDTVAGKWTIEIDGGPALLQNIAAALDVTHDERPAAMQECIARFAYALGRATFEPR